MVERHPMTTDSISPPETSKGEAFIDPEMKPILEAMQERRESRSPPAKTPVELMRTRMAEDFKFWNEGGAEIAVIRNFTIPGPQGDVRVRLYDPVPEQRQRPACVYLHGGGWIVGSLETEDRSLRELAVSSELPVFSVDYRLAPEYKFPSQVEECAAVVKWLHEHAAEFGLDCERLGIGGASAGANLALASALTLRGAGENWLKACVLLYGAFARRSDTESHRRFGAGDFGLTTEDMSHFWSLYVGSPDDTDVDRRAEPLYADLSDLPPVLLIGAALDPLLDDTRQLFERLQAACIPSHCTIYPGVVHGFTVMLRQLSAGGRAMREVGTFLQKTLQR